MLSMKEPYPKKRKQTPRKRPPKMLELDDHELMEKIFGKRVMKKVDKIVESRSK